MPPTRRRPTQPVVADVGATRRSGSPAARPRREGLALRVVLLLVSTGIALAIAEVALRVLQPFGFRQSGSTLVLRKNRVYDIRADEHSRSDQLAAHVVHTKSSLGFRGPEPPADFPSWLTIVAIGGSTTECFYLGDGQTWPERLAAHLEPAVPKLWVANAGLDGHSTFGHLLLTRQAVVGLEPDVTLYLVGLNDVFTDAPHDSDRLETDPLGALADRSALVATLLNLSRWRKTRSIEDLGAMPKPVALRDRPAYDLPAADAARMWRDQEPRVEGFRSRLEALVELNREHGIEPVLITQPTLLGGVDARTGLDMRRIEVVLTERVDGAFTWRLLERYNDVTREVGRRRGVPVVDLARELAKDSTFFYDFFHFTDPGADRVGAIVGEALRPWLAERFPRYLRQPPT